MIKITDIRKQYIY